MTTIQLPYGKQRLEVTLPEDCHPTTIAKPALPVVADPDAAVAAALDEPVGSEPLEALAAGRSSACIVLCDITRPVPNRLFLNPLLDRLAAGGIPPERVTILIATGLHRPSNQQEIVELVGRSALSRAVLVHNHRAHLDDEHSHVGHTSRGTPVRIDKRFVEADLRIVTGLVEPHFMAGYSGGRKLVAPGLAHAETISLLHNHELLAHPNTTSRVMDGNPLHEELMEITRLVGDVLAVNTAVDKFRRLVFVNFGEVRKSHEQAVAFVRRWFEVAVPRRFQTVVTSAGGHPLDATYYQTVKGIVGVAPIVADGGDILIASSCSEGLGSAAFVAAQHRLISLGAHGFLASLATKPRADIDEWQTQMQLRAQTRARVALYSDGLDDADLELTGVEAVESLQRAIVESIQRHDDEHIAVVPQGPYVCPRLG